MTQRPVGVCGALVAAAGSPIEPALAARNTAFRIREFRACAGAFTLRAPHEKTPGRPEPSHPPRGA